jgi:sugar lactone lactonase YvrE
MLAGMRKLIPALAVLAATVAGSPPALACAGPHPDTYIVSREPNVLPESLAIARNGTMYVSSLGTGAIFKGNTRDRKLHVFKAPGTDGRSKTSGVQLDGSGRIWAAGYDTRTIWVYNPDGTLIAKRTAPDAGSALNDLVVTDDAVYVTDSFTGSVWRASIHGSQVGELTRWLSAGDFPAPPGFLNGIDVTPDDRVALINGSVDGSGVAGDAHLFRVDLHARKVTEVSVTGAFLGSPDGSLLEGHRLYTEDSFANDRGGFDYAVDLGILNADLTTLHLVKRSGFAPDGATPTAVGRDGDRLLQVNSQLGADPAAPPFTVTVVPGLR